VATRSILKWRKFGCFMVEPPKPSPFRGADDADLVAALGKPCREDAPCGNAAYPVQPLFLRRMFTVDQLKAIRIRKRFDSLRKIHSVLPDVLDFFFEVPFEFHRLEHTTSCRHRTRQGCQATVEMSGLGDAPRRVSCSFRQQALAPRMRACRRDRALRARDLGRGRHAQRTREDRP